MVFISNFKETFYILEIFLTWLNVIYWNSTTLLFLMEKPKILSFIGDESGLLRGNIYRSTSYCPVQLQGYHSCRPWCARHCRGLSRTQIIQFCTVTLSLLLFSILLVHLSMLCARREEIRVSSFSEARNALEKSRNMIV